MKLTDLVACYLTYKKSVGMRFRSEAGILNSFCRTLGDIHVAEAKPAAVSAFLAGTGPVTAFWQQKFRVLTGLYRFAITRGYADSSPLPTTMPRIPPPLTPYIYTQDDLRRFLAATDALASPLSPLRAATFHTLVLILYGTGIRISEALSLTLGDVNFPENLLTVRDTKFFKSRFVPIGARLAAELSAYADRRCRLPLPEGTESAFFATRTGHALSYDETNRLFQKVRRVAGVRRERGARYQPRLHDVRHTFAVHRLTAWYREGADVQRLLPALATYLGHVDVAATQRYLHITADLLQEANRRFEQYATEEVHHV